MQDLIRMIDANMRTTMELSAALRMLALGHTECAAAVLTSLRETMWCETGRAMLEMERFEAESMIETEDEFAERTAIGYQIECDAWSGRSAA